MARKERSASEEVAELLKTQIIVQLALAGLGNRQIRAVVSCDMNRVVRITKHLRNRKQTGES